MESRDYIRDALHQAHLRACGDANDQAVSDLTSLINSLDEGDTDITTGTTRTTDVSNAAIDTILLETGIVPSGHNTPERDIVTEVARLRGEVHRLDDENDQLSEQVGRVQSERDDARTERDQALAMVKERDFRINKQAEALHEASATPVDPDHYTVDGLRHVASVRGVDVGEATTKAELADAINTPPTPPTDTEEEDA